MRRTRAALVLFVLVLAGCAGARARMNGDPPAADPPAAETEAAASVPVPAWLDGAVCYQILVRSFFDASGDGIGDLAGVRAKLDYLNDGDPATGDDLGVDALVLLPIFPSFAFHGFDVLDYRRVHPDLGTLEDLEHLTAEAHARGVKVVLDLPINATSAGHAWFDRAWLPSSPHHAWYRFRADDPGWTRPFDPNRTVWHPIGDSLFYYAVRSPAQPDLALENPPVEDELLAIMAFWLEHGVDGFRLDLIRHLVESETEPLQTDHPETHDLLARVRARLYALDPEAVLIGDAAGSTPELLPYLGRAGTPAECDAVMLRALGESLVRSVERGTSTPAAVVLEEMLRGTPHDALAAPILSAHDSPRAATELAGARERLENAASVLLTLPGAPMLLYGEELGMRDGDAPIGLASRLPLAWTDAPPQWGFTDSTAWAPFPAGTATANVATQRRDPSSLFAHYRRWIAARHASDALRRGDMRLLSGTGGRAAVLCFVRETDGERVLVAHNVDDLPASFLAEVDGARAVTVAAAEMVEAPRREADGWRIVLPPRASGAWRLE